MEPEIPQRGKEIREDERQPVMVHPNALQGLLILEMLGIENLPGAA